MVPLFSSWLMDSTEEYAAVDDARAHPNLVVLANHRHFRGFDSAVEDRLTVVVQKHRCLVADLVDRDVLVDGEHVLTHTEALIVRVVDADDGRRHDLAALADDSHARDKISDRYTHADLGGVLALDQPIDRSPVRGVVAALDDVQLALVVAANDELRLGTQQARVFQHSRDRLRVKDLGCRDAVIDSDSCIWPCGNLLFVE